jgi:hypothetical protein
MRKPRVTCKYCGKSYMAGKGIATHIRRTHPEDGLNFVTSKEDFSITDAVIYCRDRASEFSKVATTLEELKKRMQEGK